MTKQKKCRWCQEQLPIESFVDITGAKNPRGQYCNSCHLKRVEVGRQEALAEERSHISKLKIVYGEFWRHYATPEDFYTTLCNERDYCPYCGIKFEQVIPNKFNGSRDHLDHMDPLDKGGEHSIRNVVFCCGPCNIKKRKSSFQKWLQKLKPEFQRLSREIYTEKHGHTPEEFQEGCNMGRGTLDFEFDNNQSEEELKKIYPNPIVDAPPSNQPIVITLDILQAIERLPEELKEKLKRKN